MLKHLVVWRDIYLAMKLTAPTVDLSDVPAVMEDAINEAILARESFVFPGIEF